MFHYYFLSESFSPETAYSSLPVTSLKEKIVILTYKIESLVELKFDPGFRVVGGYLSQTDSILRVKLTQIFSNYSGRILVPQVTQLFRSK